MEYLDEFVIKEKGSFFLPLTIKEKELPLNKAVHFSFEGRSYIGSTSEIVENKIKIKLHYSFKSDYSDLIFYGVTSDTSYTC